MRDSPRLLAIAMAATAVSLAAVAARDAAGGILFLGPRSAIPLDRAMLAGLAGIVVVLAFFARTPRLQRLGCLLSTFLAIFASAVAGSPWIHWVVIAFAMLGMLWLMADSWQSLGDRLAATHERRLPRRWGFAIPLVSLAALAAVPVGRRQIMALEGFMPSSGGRDRFMDSASGGVGDGDHLVAGTDDIQSFAPIDDAPFMTSHEPTLYDLFDDTYNEPAKNPRQQRTIGLPPQTKPRPENHRASSSQRAGREFSLVRSPGRRPDRHPPDLRSRAVLHVKGRLPLHLKLESFDLFDGVEWQPEEEPDRLPPLSIRPVRGKPWLQIDAPTDERFMASPETHAVRVVSLDTSRLPAPNRLVGVHIADVDRVDFFRWAQADILRLDRETLPELTTIHMRSRVVDPRGLAARPGSIVNAGPSSCRQFGDAPRSLAVRDLVASWVVDIPPGWRQIERVVERVRSDNQLDPEARASPDTPHAIAEFLLETRRGPDYLFASATVWALRSLGYSARLVSGFHVAADAYDPRSGHAEVHADDVHFWAEVAVSSSTWASLEPTPGYSLLSPPPTLFGRLATAMHAVVAWTTNHPFTVAGIVAAAAVVIRLRLFLADRIDRLLVAAWSWADPATATLRMLGLLDRRCGRAGLPRPLHRTPTAWLGLLAREFKATAGAAAADAEAFLDLATRRLYQPRPATAVDHETLGRLLRAAERTWSWDVLRGLASEGTRS